MQNETRAQIIARHVITILDSAQECVLLAQSRTNVISSGQEKTRERLNAPDMSADITFDVVASAGVHAPLCLAA